jgi:hypothetical protein
LYELGPLCGDLHDEPPAEAVPDPRRGPFDSFQHVGDVRAEIPRFVPRRTAVSSEIERSDVEPVREALLA